MHAVKPDAGLQSRFLPTPPAFDARGSSPEYRHKPFGTEKLEWWFYTTVKKNKMFIRFDTIHERDGHTHTHTQIERERETDRQTDRYRAAKMMFLCRGNQTPPPNPISLPPLIEILNTSLMTYHNTETAQKAWFTSSSSLDVPLVARADPGGTGGPKSPK